MLEFFHESKTPQGIELSKIAGLQAWYMGQNPPDIKEIDPHAPYNLRTKSDRVATLHTR